jgi:hypothetical protein
VKLTERLRHVEKRQLLQRVTAEDVVHPLTLEREAVADVADVLDPGAAQEV